MSINLRYIVDDIDEAIDFYQKLGFELEMHPGPGFAAMRRDSLILYLNRQGFGGGGMQVTGDPRPGGWNRFQIETAALEDEVASLKDEGVVFHGEIVEGKGGRQALAEDPSGNLVELFERF